jgi:hypothetical protein
MGQANGCTMMSGCELSVTRWVKDPINYARVVYRVVEKTE